MIFGNNQLKIPDKYTRHENIANPNNRVVVTKEYQPNIKPSTITLDGSTKSTVMAISLTLNPESNIVKCIVIESPPDLSLLLDWWERCDFIDNSNLKQNIVRTYTYDDSTDRIGKYNLDELFDYLEKQHIKPYLKKYSPSLVNTHIKPFIKIFSKPFLYWLRVRLFKILSSIETDKLMREQLIELIPPYDRLNFNIKTNNDNIPQSDSYVVSVSTVFTAILFIPIYLLIQLLTHQMKIPDYMIVNPDWTFIQLLFLISVSCMTIIIKPTLYKVIKIIQQLC